MRVDDCVLLLVMTLISAGRGHVVSPPTPAVPLLDKMEEVTTHLQQLTASMAELDAELKEALVSRRDSGLVLKRFAHLNEDSIRCRLHLREDICEALEVMRQHAGNAYLVSPGVPGKRSGRQPASDFHKLSRQLQRKREMLHTLSTIFNNAAQLMDREKKWMTCNLNLGFTCQTQEYSAIADYYDFLNSADSPGKKRSVLSLPRPAQPGPSKS